MTTYPFLIRIRLNSLSSPQDCRDAGKVVPKPLGGLGKGSASPVLLQPPPGVPVTLILTGATPSFGVRPMSFAAFFVKSILRLPSAGPQSVTVTSVLLPVLRLVTLAVVPSGSLFDAAVDHFGEICRRWRSHDR